MIKMYNAEVLSKFPVVQHFPFGSLFSWDQDPNATPQVRSVRTSNQSLNNSNYTGATTARQQPLGITTAPWESATPAVTTATAAPWAQSSVGPSQSGLPPTRAPWASSNPPSIRNTGTTGKSQRSLPEIIDD